MSPMMLNADGQIFTNFGSVKVMVPFSDVSAVYLFDGVAKESLVGAETPLIAWQKLQLTGGAVTTVEKEGTPFIGINLRIDNPARNYVPLTGINLGVFAGRNFNDGTYMAGFKASLSIFNNGLSQ